MNKADLQKIRDHLNQLKATGDIADYHRELEWFSGNFPNAENFVFDRFCFQAFERLGLNPEPWPTPKKNNNRANNE